MSRTESHREIQIGTEVTHITRDSDTPLSSSKVKGQGHQAALLTAALTRDAGAAVTARTYWARETTATSTRRRVRHLGAHWGEEGREYSLLGAKLREFLCVSDLASLL